MAQLAQQFDPNAVEDDGGGSFDPIPAGIYEAQIIESRIDDTKSGGKMLVLQVEVLGPKYVKRQIFDQLNIVNANSQAQDIAARTLKRICEAVGHQGVLTDSETLHFKPMRIRVAIDPNPGYSPKNVIKGYDALGANAPPENRQTATRATAVEKPAAEPKKTAPWRK